MQTLAQERPRTIPLSINNPDFDGEDLIIEMMKTEGYKNKPPRKKSADPYEIQFLFVRTAEAEPKITVELPDFTLRVSPIQYDPLDWVCKSTPSFSGFGTHLYANRRRQSGWFRKMFNRCSIAYSNVKIVGTQKNVEHMIQNLSDVLKERSI